MIPLLTVKQSETVREKEGGGSGALRSDLLIDVKQTQLGKKSEEDPELSAMISLAIRIRNSPGGGSGSPGDGSPGDGSEVLEVDQEVLEADLKVLEVDVEVLAMDLEVLEA